MNRVYDELEAEDIFVETTELMRQSIISVEQNCQSLREHIAERRRLIADSLRNTGDYANKAESALTRATSDVYDYIRKELLKLQEICQEYRAKIQADMASETIQRLQPPHRICPKAVKRAYDLCNFKHNNREDNRDSSFRKGEPTWNNVSSHYLKHTQNIMFAPKIPMPSEFDESDDKFKQELAILRTKMFSSSRKLSESRNEGDIADEQRLSIGTTSKKEFIETVKKADSYVIPTFEIEMAKVDVLKFVDGAFKHSDSWTKLLDMFGQQLRSRWCLVICPQIENLLKRYKIDAIHLSPTETFNFLMRIPENGSNCRISRKDLVPLVGKSAEVRWLLDSRAQLKTIIGKDVAATLIQTRWRGYWIRKRLFDAKRKYIAASIIWVSWFVVKKKRQMHERYLRNMLTSLDRTRQLGSKLSNEYGSMITSDHVVIHIPSAGYSLDVRRTFDGANFAIYQNTMALRLSFLKNIHAHVIYVLPVEATEDLLRMYRDLIESVRPNENVHERIDFLELSQARTFANCSFNVSRTLHASEDTLLEIEKIVDEKPVYALPWIIDECDVRISGNSGIPLLVPDVETQRDMLDKSNMSNTIDKLGLRQPYCVNDVKDYRTLCIKLAEQICANTEICVWLFKLNVGSTSLHTGVFLINHISIPFMAILRKEREVQGDAWALNTKTKLNFLHSLNTHLPTIVSTVTRFSKCYPSWDSFYSHMTKYGCQLQAVPNEKFSKYVSITAFIPGNATGDSPQWTGTAEKIYSARHSQFFNVGYAIPQTFVDNSELEPIFERVTTNFQKTGYFGYLSIDLYCYRRTEDEKIVTLVVEINPCYEHVNHFVDWMKFAIDGSYDRALNKFDTDVGVLPDERARKSSTFVRLGAEALNLEATTERCAIALSELFHSQFSTYRWKELQALSKDCGIRWNNTTKEGSHLVLHDGTLKTSAMLVSISSNMESAMILAKNCLKKLHKAFRGDTRDSVDTNFLQTISYIEESLEKYRSFSVDKCNPLRQIM